MVREVQVRCRRSLRAPSDETQTKEMSPCYLYRFLHNLGQLSSFTLCNSASKVIGILLPTYLEVGKSQHFDLHTSETIFLLWCTRRFVFLASSRRSVVGVGLPLLTVAPARRARIMASPLQRCKLVESLGDQPSPKLPTLSCS